MSKTQCRQKRCDHYRRLDFRSSVRLNHLKQRRNLADISSQNLARLEMHDYF